MNPPPLLFCLSLRHYDEGISTEAQGRALTQVLGEDRHFDILAAVYMLRSDVALVVRNSAIHIWKTVGAVQARPWLESTRFHQSLIVKKG